MLHDDSALRLTGDPRPAHTRSSRELLAQRYIDAPDESLLLFDEALALLAGRVPLDIEVKPTAGIAAEDLAQRVFTALMRAGSPQDVCVSSSDPEILRALKARGPRLAVGFIAFGDSARSPVRTAVEALCDLLVISQRRVTAELVAQAHDAGLTVWTYTVNDIDVAQALYELNVDAVITDDYPRLQQRLDPDPTTVDSPGPLLLALDLGSTSTKAALVCPLRGIVARAATPTPFQQRGDYFEHDPTACLSAARSVLATLADDVTQVPAALGIAAQRSTGLWIDRFGTPLTSAPSWRDPRGGERLTGLAPQRAALEAAAGFPLATAWTAVKAQALRPAPADGDKLVPLGAWIAAQLCGTEVAVDPTLANRMYLVDDTSLQWSALLLASFGLSMSQLPVCVPSVAQHGSFSWASGDAVRWTALIGDQQAAYVGAAGPLEKRLVLNIGTAVFAMRLEELRRPGLADARRAPLWTSRAVSRPAARLVELPLVEPPFGGAIEGGADSFAREVARRLAFGDDAPHRFAVEIAGAVARLQLPMDQTVTICGGAATSPHFADLLSRVLPLTPVFCCEPEATLLGAARLAAAGAHIAWRLAPGAGAQPRVRV